MFTRFSLPLCTAAALALAPVGASALNFTVGQYSKTDLTSAQTDFAAWIGPDWKFATTEDFEGFGDTSSSDFVGVKQIGQDSTAVLETAVGSFTTLGGTGRGTTAIGTSGSASDSDRGQTLAIRQNNDTFVDEDGNLGNLPNGGRQNTSMGEGHKTYLDSNDTKGFKWIASAGGTAFDRLLFTLTDPSDVSRTLTISALDFSDTYKVEPKQPNGEIFNVLIEFRSPVTEATISLAKNGTGDGFSIDNATVGAVPLPAAVWLLMFASGGLIAAKRRSAVRA